MWQASHDTLCVARPTVYHKTLLRSSVSDQKSLLKGNSFSSVIGRWGLGCFEKAGSCNDVQVGCEVFPLNYLQDCVEQM